MAESAPIQQPAPVAQIQPKALPLFQARIKGMIASTRVTKYQGMQRRFTVLRLPAVDEFSYPATIEVSSKSILGQKEELWEGVVVLGGTQNNYEITDEHGEILPVNSARNYLTVVE